MTRRSRRAAHHAGRAESPVAVRDSRSGLRQFARERPLLVVGAGVALGMALGALLPWSRIEDDLWGEQAEKLKDGAIELASDGYEKVRSVAQSTYEAATETLRGGESTSASSVTKAPSSESKTPGTAPYHQ
jgi:ElaB/YqjD/DUF883 family membrane-anchored ribosome-binding protein